MASPNGSWLFCIIFTAAFVIGMMMPALAQDTEVASGDDTPLKGLQNIPWRKAKLDLEPLHDGSISLEGIPISTGQGTLDAFIASLSMILVSEIGDETFIIAALMAMRHPKSIVLCGALSALFVMTVLSTELGRIVPNLISKKHTNSAATVLYAFFGFRLLYIAWRADSKNTQKKEIEEVEEKLENASAKTTFRRILSRFLTPIFLESFILTFLAEWGDRSQIATIAKLRRIMAFMIASVIYRTNTNSMVDFSTSLLQQFNESLLRILKKVAYLYAWIQESMQAFLCRAPPLLSPCFIAIMHPSVNCYC